MVYIQSNSERTLPHHFDAACAMYGAMDSALDFRLTSFEEVQSGKFDRLIKTNHFVGSVEFMREVFNRVDKQPQPIMNSDRQHETLTIQEIRDRVGKGEKFFVKPFQQKLFTGLVVDIFFLSSLRELQPDLKVMAYPVIKNIATEWRVYVMHGRIEDARNYSGDFKVGIDYSFVEEKIKALRDKLPCCYTMDVGVAFDAANPFSTVNNFIVEFNDMYAIGNYGMVNDVYLRMLRDRYFEIMRS